MLWVLEDRDYARGRELIESYLEDSVAEGSQDSWICQRCGEIVDAEFNICWNCNGLPKLRHSAGAGNNISLKWPAAWNFRAILSHHACTDKKSSTEKTMGKLLKIVGGLLGLILLLVVAAVVIIPMVIDPNDYKDEIIAKVQGADRPDIEDGWRSSTLCVSLAWG